MKLSVLSWSARPTRLFGLALACRAGERRRARRLGRDGRPGGAASPAAADDGNDAAARPDARSRAGWREAPRPTQRAQVHQIFDAAEADLKQARPAERADHEQMQQLFAAPVVDANAVETVRARIEARHDAQSRRVTQAMVDASVVLSAEQRQAIAAQMTAQAHAFGGARRAASSANE